MKDECASVSTEQDCCVTLVCIWFECTGLWFKHLTLLHCILTDSSVSGFSVQLYFHLLSLTVRQSHPFFFIDNRFSEMSKLLFLFFLRTCYCSTTPQAAPLLSLALQALFFFFFQVGLSFSTCSEKSFNFTSLETVLALLRIKGGTELNWTELTPSFQLSINSEFSALRHLLKIAAVHRGQRFSQGVEHCMCEKQYFIWYSSDRILVIAHSELHLTAILIID